MSNLLGLSFLEMIRIFMLIFQVRRFGQITSRMNIFRLSFISCRCIEKSSENFLKISRRLTLKFTAFNFLCEFYEYS